MRRRRAAITQVAVQVHVRGKTPAAPRISQHAITFVHSNTSDGNAPRRRRDAREAPPERAVGIVKIAPVRARGLLRRRDGQASAPVWNQAVS